MPTYWQAFAPLVLFTFVASVTPGPNNMMLASSGLTHGFRRTIPHMLGVALGFVLMVVILGLGLGSLFEHAPWFYVGLKYASAAYLLWLAWKIATSSATPEANGKEKPISFLQAAGFQWVNPKAWVMAVGIVAAYVPKEGFFFNLAIAGVICGLVNCPSVALWAGFGAGMRRWLHRPFLLRSFNYAMALLLVASLYPLAFETASR
ncbi:MULTISPECIES: LysE family translocator [Gluconobacter]|uniref:LysE family translocator n=1 Tax=Gluconobacter TaxID=441 RepID=UPI00062C8573|nr:MULTISPECIES: LysE family translocator [Gluconobacter]